MIFDIFIVRCLGGYFFPDSVEPRISTSNSSWAVSAYVSGYKT